MYIHSVKLINFKSIGDYPESEIVLEPRVTTIIGKNESGKSNVLDGLSRINFTKANAGAFSQNVVNRNSVSGTENKYIITLKPREKEKALGLLADTMVEITKEQCAITGGLFDYYLQNVYHEFESLAGFLDDISANPMSLSDREFTLYKTYKNELIQKDNLDMYRKMNALEFFKARGLNLSSEHRESFKEKLESILDVWSAVSSMLPEFFYRNTDKHLNTSYKIEDVEKELKNPTVSPNSLLYSFVKLIEIPFEDFIEAVRSGYTARQETLRRRINKHVNSKINIPFQNFYQTETIALDLGFNAGVVTFVVQSEDGEALMLSERSNGLKWYLETFIDAQAAETANTNVVYLLDEPGTSLHVNAQRESSSVYNSLSIYA